MDSLPEYGFICGTNCFLQGEIRCELPVRLFSGVQIYGSLNIGMYSYLSQNTFAYNADIGRYSSVAFDVCLGPPIHPLNFLTTIRSDIMRSRDP